VGDAKPPDVDLAVDPNLVAVGSDAALVANSKLVGADCEATWDHGLLEGAPLEQDVSAGNQLASASELHNGVAPPTDNNSVDLDGSLAADSKLVCVDADATWTGELPLASSLGSAEGQRCGIACLGSTAVRAENAPAPEELEAGSALRGTYSFTFEDSDT